MDFTKNICDIIVRFFWRFYPFHPKEYYLLFANFFLKSLLFTI